MPVTTNPFPIGSVTITPGTRIRLGAALGATDAPALVRTLIFKSLGTGTISYGDASLVLPTTGVIDTIASGERVVIGGYRNLNDIAWKDFYVDGDTADVLLVSGQTI